MTEDQLSAAINEILFRGHHRNHRRLLALIDAHQHLPMAYACIGWLLGYAWVKTAGPPEFMYLVVCAASFLLGLCTHRLLYVRLLTKRGPGLDQLDPLMDETCRRVRAGQKVH